MTIAFINTNYSTAHHYLGRKWILFVSLAETLCKDKFSLVHDRHAKSRNSSSVASQLDIDLQLCKNGIHVARDCSTSRNGIRVLFLSFLHTVGE